MMRRIFQVVCDECLTDQEEWNYWASEARATAKLNGWKRRGKRDLCPECAERANSMGEIAPAERQAELDADSRVTR